MAKRDLTKEKIILATIELSASLGLDNISFPRLAEYFDIKAPSLYNHFKNMADVRIATAEYLITQLTARMQTTLPNQSSTEALRSYAYIYRDFAREYAPVYSLLNAHPEIRTDNLIQLNRELLTFVNHALSAHGVVKSEILHYARTYRSMLHGYITLNQLGYFQSQPVTDDESFDWMVDHFITLLPTH